MKDKICKAFEHAVSILGSWIVDVKSVILAVHFVQFHFPFPPTLFHSLVVPQTSFPQLIHPRRANQKLPTPKPTQRSRRTTQRIYQRVVKPTAVTRLNPFPNPNGQALFRFTPDSL
ncbi:hypothetical protein V8G54_016667 [Vigna mungo]|uniref:Uncharacterized protein n=1 Tax=Vigna mungo TaxID=3915 RepID=A0AAQ3RZK2_VIGMU